METRAFRDAIEPYKRRVKLFLSLHAYGQSLLYPYSYAQIYPKNKIEMVSLHARCHTKSGHLK